MQKASKEDPIKNIQTGTISGVHGSYVFIANERYPTIYASRDKLNFPDPYLGLVVEFELHIQPNMRDPVAANVRRI